MNPTVPTLAAFALVLCALGCTAGTSDSEAAADLASSVTSCDVANGTVLTNWDG